jgi:hypothetical protein
MPRVPQYQQQVGVSNLPSARIQNYTTAETLGADVAQAVGKTGGMLGQIAQQEQEKADVAALMDADRQLADLELSLFNDPENGAYAKRGRDAFGLPEQVFPQWDQQVGQIEGRLTPAQRDAFRRQAQGRRTDLQRGLSRHVLQESERFYSDEAKAYVSTAVQSAAANYTDPERVNTEIERVARGVMSMPEMRGASPVVINEAIRQAQSKVYVGVAERMLLDDPSAAETYVLANQDRMSPGDVQNLREKLQPLSQAREVTAIADQILSGVGPAGAASGPGPGSEAVWANMIRRESGGRQFDADGKPLTSSAGAVGIAQVMPDTGPEAARLAGLPWDEERYKTDADYNKALGRAYFQQQVKTFGDDRLAAAAYNAGPGAVQKWLREIGDPRTGEVTMAEFVERIPFEETRNYVKAVAPDGPARAQAASGEPTLSSLMAQARGVSDPRQRRSVEQEITRMWTLRETEMAAADEAMTEDINAAVEAAPPGARLDTVLSPDQLAWATRSGKVSAWQARLTNRINDAQVVTDPRTMTSLQALFTRAENGDAAAMAEVRAMNPVEYFDKLDPTARDYVQRRRGALVAPARSQEKPADFASEDELLRVHVFGPLGITPKPDDKEDETAAALRTQFQTSYWQRLNERQKLEGRPASSEEKQQIMRDLMTSFAVTTRNRFLPDSTEQVRAFQIEVPDDQRSMIVDAYRRKLNRDPEESEILAAYARNQGMRLQQGAN